MLRTLRFPAVVLALCLGAACNDEGLFRPRNVVPVEPLFGRYVSVGNSITAGFQSGGINEQTQQVSYAALLAFQMRTPFFAPLMALPGCPPLFTNVFTQARASSVACALRKFSQVPPPHINNVAVPGAEVMDAISNLDPASNANALTLFFLGGLTQTQMLQRVRPTFVTVWIGNNDVLASVTQPGDAGDPSVITPPDLFATRYAMMMDSIDEVRPAGGVLIGVAEPMPVPYLTQGQAYFAAKQANQLPSTFTVGPNCNPRALGGNGDSVLVPFPFGGALLTQAAAGTPVTLSCMEPETVQPAEIRNLGATVAAYNAAIEGEADARGWAYFDPKPVFDSLFGVAVADPTNPNPPIRLFPLFGQACSANPFGLAFSCDAIHPSTATHKLIGNKLIEAVNAKYATSLARLP